MVKRAAIQVGTAAIVVAAVGYVAQFLAARLLGPAEYAKFAVFWALLFVVVGFLSGLSQEIIRVSRITKLQLDEGLHPSDNGKNPRIAVLALAASTSIAAAVLLSGFAWGPAAIGPDWQLSVVLIAIAAVVIGGALSLGGTLAGLARWRPYSGLVVLEGVARLLSFVLAALVLPTVLGFSIAAVLAFVPALFVALLWGEFRRVSFSIRSDAPLGESITRILRSVAASGLYAILIIGWPALLSAAAAANPRGSNDVSLGVLILLVTLTRAPIMLPLTTFQNALVARFTGLDLRGRRRWVAAGSGIIVSGSVVLAGIAALVGPPLLPLVFGAEFQTTSGIVAGLTAATSGLGIITLAGIAAITAARHTLYLAGWGVAIAVTLVVLFLAPLPFEWAAVLALFVGPLAGAAVQLSALRTTTD
jgi:O-antigen/teichoic acid export membrane protein